MDAPSWGSRRRLTQPLRRLGAAAGELAAGRSPEPVPRGGAEEIDELAGAFNEMSEQLTLARDAERGVLLSVSHDLRTPLTSIRGYAEGIEDGTVEPQQAAAVVGREAARPERLVGDLLVLARLRQGVLEVRSESVDLAALAREAEERLRPRAQEAGVAVRLEGGEAPARADHGRTLQVVSNLLDNAIRVSPAGGEVTVSVAPGRLRVADRGPGIPEEDLPRAFERFHPPFPSWQRLLRGRRPRLGDRTRTDGGDGRYRRRRQRPRRWRRLHDRAAGAVVISHGTRGKALPRAPGATLSRLDIRGGTPPHPHPSALRDGNDHLRTAHRAA